MPDWPDRENTELLESSVFQDVCDWLLLWDGTEAEVWGVRHWQWKLQSARCWLLGRTGMYLGTGQLSLPASTTPLLSQTLIHSFSLLGTLLLRMFTWCDIVNWFTQVFFYAQIVSTKKLTRPLVLKNKSPAGKGTISVSCFYTDWKWHFDCQGYLIGNDSTFIYYDLCFEDLCWGKNRQ